MAAIRCAAAERWAVPSPQDTNAALRRWIGQPDVMQGGSINDGARRQNTRQHRIANRGEDRLDCVHVQHHSGARPLPDSFAIAIPPGVLTARSAKTSVREVDAYKFDAYSNSLICMICFSVSAKTFPVNGSREFLITR